MGFLKKIFGTHSDHELKRLYPIADKIEAMSDEYAALTDEQLRAKTDEFKQRYWHALAAQPQVLAPLRDALAAGPVTLVYGARDTEHNQAVVLRDYLLAHPRRTP